MIALIRKNLRLWGYGKSLALFAGCILFSISGRLNGGIAYERHILSAVLMAVSLESRGNRMKKAFFLGSLLVIGIFSALAVRAP